MERTPGGVERTLTLWNAPLARVERTHDSVERTLTSVECTHASVERALTLWNAPLPVWNAP